jgi:hypothetical protein
MDATEIENLNSTILLNLLMSNIAAELNFPVYLYLFQSTLYIVASQIDKRGCPKNSNVYSRWPVILPQPRMPHEHFSNAPFVSIIAP